MGALSDILLTGGCALHIEAIHGETITVLDGLDAGRRFTAVRELDQDVMLMSELSEDRRAKIVLRFINGTTPRIEKTGKVQTENGQKWTATRRQEAGFLTDDFELVEITAKDQQ